MLEMLQHKNIEKQYLVIIILLCQAQDYKPQVDLRDQLIFFKR